MISSKFISASLVRLIPNFQVLAQCFAKSMDFDLGPALRNRKFQVVIPVVSKRRFDSPRVKKAASVTVTSAVVRTVDINSHRGL